MTMQQDPATPIEDQTSTREAPVLPPSPQRQRQRPNLSGDLRATLDSGPAFASALRGYDRLQVDNYVAWVEQELLASRRAMSELVKRLGACEAELQRSQQMVAQSPQSGELTTVSDRVAEILRLAAKEADAARIAGTAEAADIVAQAHAEADLIKRRAQQLEAHAATHLERAERLQAEAEAAVDRSRVESERIQQQAAAERQRLDEQAAEARALAAAAAAQQLERLLGRQEDIHAYLRAVTDQLDEALQLITDDPARQFSFVANIAVAPVEQHPTPAVDGPQAYAAEVAHILANVKRARRAAPATSSLPTDQQSTVPTAPGGGRGVTEPRKRESRTGADTVQKV